MMRTVLAIIGFVFGASAFGEEIPAATLEEVYCPADGTFKPDEPYVPVVYDEDGNPIAQDAQ